MAAFSGSVGKLEYNPRAYITRLVRIQAPLIKVGDAIPRVFLSRLTQDRTPVKFTTDRDMSGALEVLFVVPGAFTPVCTNDHVPSFVKNIAKLKALGVQKISCLAPNDRDVVHAWQKQVDSQWQISMIPDVYKELTFRMGLGMDRANDGRDLGFAPTRAALVLKNGRVIHIEVEKEGPGVCKLTSGDTIVQIVEQILKQNTPSSTKTSSSAASTTAAPAASAAAAAAAITAAPAKK